MCTVSAGATSRARMKAVLRTGVSSAGWSGTILCANLTVRRKVDGANLTVRTKVDGERDRLVWIHNDQNYHAEKSL